MTEDTANGGQSQPQAKGSRALRFSINGLLAIVFLMIIAIAAAGLWLRHQEILTEAGSNAEKLTGILSEHLAIRFDTIDNTLYELAQFNRMVGGPEESGMEWMSTLPLATAGLYAIESVIVTNADGITTFSSLPINMGDSWKEQPLFEHLSADPTNDDLYTNPPVRSRDNSRMVIPVGRVLRTPNSEFQGMLIATLAPEQLRDFYDSVDVGESGVITILHPENQILFRQPANRKLAGEVWPIIPIAEGPIEGERRGVVTGPIEDGSANYLTAYRTSEKTGLTVAVSLVESELLAAWWNDVYIALGFVVIIGVVLIGVAIMVSRALRTAGAQTS